MKINTFCRLFEYDKRRRIALIHAFFAIILIKIGLLLFPFQTIADLVSPTDGISKKKDQDTVELTSWAVRMVSYHIGGTRCLVQALAMMAMLSCAGISSILCIGVAKGGGSPFEAHAWVEIDGNAVIGGPEPEKFTKLGNLR